MVYHKRLTVSAFPHKSRKRHKSLLWRASGCAQRVVDKIRRVVVIVHKPAGLVADEQYRLAAFPRCAHGVGAVGVFIIHLDVCRIIDRLLRRLQRRHCLPVNCLPPHRAGFEQRQQKRNERENTSDLHGTGVFCLYGKVNRKRTTDNAAAAIFSVF